MVVVEVEVEVVALVPLEEVSPINFNIQFS
jgi:hypothetical protein